MTTQAAAAPTVTVITATYNWSSALRHAIRSVLAQTFSDFELLVVGDCCTDDSEAVVASFADPRVRWLSTDRNHGSQHGPNNLGIKHARGRYVAYLGHDDLWWPTHLEAMLRTADATGAEVLASVTVWQGPAETGMWSVSGLFPENAYTPRYFFPPSSLMHERQLAIAIGGWNSRENSKGGAVDNDLLLRFHESGATFASTNELTVFKLNAAWRRNSYKTQRSDEQAALLEQFATGGESFRQAQLLNVLRSVIEDRFLHPEKPPEAYPEATELARRMGSYKGFSKALTPEYLVASDGGIDFFIDDPFVGFEWHDIERQGDARWRWTGPSSLSSFYLPIVIDRPYRLEIGVQAVLEEAALMSASLSILNRPIASTKEPRETGGWTWSAILDPAKFPNQSIDLVTMEISKPRRPLDVHGFGDRRWLGVCVNGLRLVPLPPKPSSTGVAARAMDGLKGLLSRSLSSKGGASPS